ncbi:MAG: CsgG/HfaB family protein [Candidatus Cloacimonetes bacterium]|nr:CsgG/HfaB family protein [Candidatus Cloacimonadota bacterium]
MKNHVLLLVITTIILASGFAGCARNKKLHKKALSYFERGDYDSATFLAVESLLLKPDYDKAFYTIKEAYPKANQIHLDKISALQNIDSDDKWESILAEYQALDKLHQSVRRLPVIRDPDTGATLRFDSRDYSAEIAMAKTNAAENYYQKGIHQSMIDNSRDSQKKAAGLFKSALKLVPDYKDSATRYETARQNAVIRVAVTAFENKSGVGDRYGAIADILTDLVLSYIMQDQSRCEFVEIISRAQMDQVLKEQELGASGLVDETSAARIGVLLGAQEILSGRILQVDYVRPKTTTVDQHETAEIQEEGEDEIEARSESKEVSCHFRKYTKSSSVRILASYSVVDVATGRIQTQESLSATQSFEAEWGKLISGDARALNCVQEYLIEEGEVAAPSAKEMVNAALDDLSRDIAYRFFKYIK